MNFLISLFIFLYFSTISAAESKNIKYKNNTKYYNNNLINKESLSVYSSYGYRKDNYQVNYKDNTEVNINNINSHIAKFGLIVPLDFIPKVKNTFIDVSNSQSIKINDVSIEKEDNNKYNSTISILDTDLSLNYIKNINEYFNIESKIGYQVNKNNINFYNSDIGDSQNIYIYSTGYYLGIKPTLKTRPGNFSFAIEYHLNDIEYKNDLFSNINHDKTKYSADANKYVYSIQYINKIREGLSLEIIFNHYNTSSNKVKNTYKSNTNIINYVDIDNLNFKTNQIMASLKFDF